MKVLIRAVLVIGLILNTFTATPVTDETCLTDDGTFIIVTMDEMPYGW